MSDFTGRHIVITGASTGIGLSAARLLGGRGARLSLIARSAGKLSIAVAEIEAAGGTARAYSADVSDRVALIAALDEAVADHGPAYGLFANAGSGGSFASFPATSDENWDAIIATNLTGVFVAMRHVIPAMIAAKSGSIVVTGSLASERGMANNPGYVASKHAVLGLARAAALECAADNVRVNCILPGLIETPLLHNIAGDDIAGTMAMLGHAVPQGRVGTPDEVAQVVAFLLSDAASHVTAQSWAVDGGILGTLAMGG